MQGDSFQQVGRIELISAFIQNVNDFCQKRCVQINNILLANKDIKNAQVKRALIQVIPCLFTIIQSVLDFVQPWLNYLFASAEKKEFRIVSIQSLCKVCGHVPVQFEEHYRSQLIQIFQDDIARRKVVTLNDEILQCLYEVTEVFGIKSIQWIDVSSIEFILNYNLSNESIKCIYIITQILHQNGFSILLTKFTQLLLNKVQRCLSDKALDVQQFDILDSTHLPNKFDYCCPLQDQNN